jgi:hypothetical protein
VYPIEKMCKAFKVSRSGYYGWLNSEPSKRAIENQEILQEIKLIYQESGQTGSQSGLGLRSMVALESVKLCKEITFQFPGPGLPAGPNAHACGRSMKQAELRANRIKRFKVTTDSKHSYPVSENILDRNFTTNATGKAWVSDITYIRTITGWLYLTVVLDLADRKIVGSRLK